MRRDVADDGAEYRIPAEGREESGADGGGDDDARVSGDVGADADQGEKEGDHERRSAEQRLLHEGVEEAGVLHVAYAEHHHHHDAERREGDVRFDEILEEVEEELLFQKVPYVDGDLLGRFARPGRAEVGDRDVELAEDIGENKYYDRKNREQKERIGQFVSRPFDETEKTLCRA